MHKKLPKIKDKKQKDKNQRLCRARKFGPAGCEVLLSGRTKTRRQLHLCNCICLLRSDQEKREDTCLTPVKVDKESWKGFFNIPIEIQLLSNWKRREQSGLVYTQPEHRVQPGKAPVTQGIIAAGRRHGIVCTHLLPVTRGQ